jgi:thioredoxin-related protein
VTSIVRPLRTLVAALALLALAAPAAPATSAPKASGGRWHSKLADAQAEARKSGKYLFVDLYAEWCGWCKQLERNVFSTPRFQQYASKFVLLRVDTEDRAEGTELQNRYGAETLPTTLVLTPEMVLAAKIGGYAATETYIQKTEQQLAVFAALERRYRELATSSDALAVRAAAESWHERGDGKRAAALYRRLGAIGGMKPDEAAWTGYLLADSLRLAGDLDGAQQEIDRARAQAAGSKSLASLVERLDLLSVTITEQRGTCKERVAALESFLRAHPSSPYSAPARRTLQALRSDGGAACG